jgi:pyridoxamine 5'-phosphate oxidase
VRARPLGEGDLDPDPLGQFDAWYAEAEASVEYAGEIAVATATREGAPSVRMVLFRGADPRGFAFYTSYESRKGVELADNPRAALLFYWHPLGRQVRVEGEVARVPESESAAYFASRPAASRLSAWASRQSAPIASRAKLEAAVRAAAERFAGGDVPLPDEWGGYRVLPRAYEFWQHRDDRLHDRFRYTPAGGGWLIERLQP